LIGGEIGVGGQERSHHRAGTATANYDPPAVKLGIARFSHGRGEDGGRSP
jgi:hypothetical protein